MQEQRSSFLFVIWPPIKRKTAVLEAAKGEMAEWLKARAWKVRILLTGYRGFESLSLRHPGIPSPLRIRSGYKRTHYLHNR